MTTALEPNRFENPESFEHTVTASRSARLADALEPVVVVIGLTALAYAFVRWTGGFWLPLDAAHFSAEAEWLRGNRDILPNIHPPLFPGLVLIADTVLGRWDAVLVAVSFVFALYVVAVYALLRCWHRRTVAWFGAIVAATSPLLAEIFGWGGGANLLGFAALIGACAAAERWTSTGRGALVSGALCGCAGASHPVAGVLAVVMVLAIAVSACVAARSAPSKPWRSAVLFGVGGVPFAVAAASYYLTVSGPAQTTFGTPELGVTLDLLEWAGRENVVVLLLQIGALLWPFLAWGRRSRRVGLVFALVILVMTATLRGDPSYQSRVMYLLPVLVGIFSADMASIVTRARRRGSRELRWRSDLIVAVALIAILLQMGFVTRLDDANDYYRRLTIDDVRLLEQLDDESIGVVATSHWGNSTGEPTGWFVNAAARRRALSPIGPWLSTDLDETREGAAMQRLFAGQVGIERGSLQVAASATPSGLYALQMAVEEDGWFEPAVVLDSARSRFPFPVVQAQTEVVSDAVVLTLLGPDPTDDVIELFATIDTTGVVIRGVPGPEVDGNWHVVFSSAPETFGSATPRDATTAAFEIDVDGERQSGLLTVDADVPVRVTTYPTGFPIDLDVVDPPIIGLTWRFDDHLVGSSRLSTFDEDRIIASFGIETVVVWNNTGLIPRFTESCFRQTAAGPTITIFERIGSSSEACGAPEPRAYTPAR